MKAMILAAGLGTRLRPLTLERAKPAIPLLGKPLVIHLIERLLGSGVTSFRLNLHHLPHTIEDVFESGTQADWPVSFRFEPEILGTAGGLKASENFFDNETLIMVNGDIVMDFPLQEALEFHKSSGALATLVLRPQEPPYRFTPLRVDKTGRLCNFKGTNVNGEALSGTYLFTGVHIMSPRIFDYIPPGRFWEINDQVYPAAMAQGETVLGFPLSEGYWNDLGDPCRYLRAQRDALLRGQGDSLISRAPDTQVLAPSRLGPFVSLEPGCVLEPESEAENSILWRNSSLKRGVRVKNCIIGSGVAVDADCRNKVVTRNGEISFDAT